MATILLIDDEPSIRLLYSDVLAEEGHEVLEAECGSEAFRLMEKKCLDLVLLDLKLRSENGLNLLEEIFGRYPDLPVILLTAFTSFQDDYLSWLADAYVIKSTDPSELLREVNRVLQKEKTRLPSTGGDGSAVAAHAAHDQPILIEGEAGTGKAFLARLIHQCSGRRHGPFVAICCEALSEESVEAALFGSIRALPSRGNRIQRGLVERATGGTLFISGISTLSSLLKVEIARLIQFQEFRRPGGHLPETATSRRGPPKSAPSSRMISG